MRPQDIAILLKIISLGNQDWNLIKLSSLLKISLSEISESLNRSQLGGLIDSSKKHVNRNNLIEFLEHGIRCVFPVIPGTLVRGIPTAHSHHEIKKFIISENNFVWPDNNGEVMGLMIEPLYQKIIEPVKDDALFYIMVAMVDAIRFGKQREKKIVIQELKKHILHASSN